jgi:outer membrane receptor protein involved in Fe transport
MSGGAFQWTIGGFYRDMDRQLLIPEGVTEFFGILYPFDYFIDNTSESYSIFADGTYRFSDRWEIGAGVRYFEDDQTEHLVGDVEQSGTFDSVDPRFNVSYSINDRQNLYASAAKGFRSGGFNGGDLPDYDPEELWSYEFGYKASLAGGALFFETAIYFTKYDNMLRRGLVFVSPELGFQSLISNIGEVEITGIEASFTWQATDALTFDFAGTIIDAEVTKLDAEGTSNEVGDPIDYVPDYSFTVGAVYDFNWTDDMPGYFRVNYSYRDKMPYVDRTSFPDENLPQWSDTIGLFDARLGLRTGTIYTEIYAQNFTDVNRYIDPYHAWNNANRTRPRAFGIRLGVEF